MARARSLGQRLDGGAGLSHLPGGGANFLRQQDTPDEHADLLASVCAVTGSRARALELITQPQKSFGGESPVDLASVGRLQDALAFIESISSGGAG